MCRTVKSVQDCEEFQDCEEREESAELLKPVLNWANVCLPEHTSDTSTNYDSFLN